MSALRFDFAARPARPFRDLHLAGLAGVSLYAVAAAFFYNVTAGGPREGFRWALVLGLAAAFAVGYRAVCAVAETARVRRIVAGYAVALAASAAVVPAFHSDDLYVYVNIGWQQAGYGVNPYQTLLYEMPTGLTDPMFCQQWQFVPCTYGFLFALEARAACEISGRDHATAVLALKAVAVGSLLLLGFVVWLGGRALGRPDPVRGAFLTLWNPLLLLHGVSNAHNDVQFALGVAIAVVAYLRGRWLMVFPALAAAALVKYLSVAVVPFVLLASVRRFGWRRTAASCAAAVALCAACWWPYRAGFDAAYFERTGTNLAGVHNSLATIAAFPFETLKFDEAIRRRVLAGAKAVCWAAFAAVAGAAFLNRCWRPGGPADVVRDVVLVLLVMIVVSPKYHAWYLAMVLPLAAWLPPGRLRRAAFALGIANMLSFTFVYQAHLLNALVLLVLPLALTWRRTPVPGLPAIAVRLPPAAAPRP